MSKDRVTPPGAPAPKIEPIEDEEQISFFDLHMPGVMTAPEVEAMDLGKWLLVVKQHFVHMEVRIFLSFGALFLNLIQDLVDWEKSSVTSPMSIKGMVAELAAALGPNIVKNSAVDLFS
jgi:arginine-tRNA-protein transferase